MDKEVGTERSVKHDTIVLERTYNASLARVFAAWADPSARARWDVPGDGWELAEFESDFRVGGREFSRFGPKGDPRYWSEGRYLISFRTGVSSLQVPCTTVKRARLSLWPP